MNNQQAQRFLRNEAKEYNSPLQALSDYGTGISLGALGQQGLNWATEGSDPNPLISGLISAPITRALSQGTRATALGVGKHSFEAGLKGLDANSPEVLSDIYKNGAKIGLSKFLYDAPVEVALGSASLLGATPASIGTSIYNVATNGQDIDNNVVSSLGMLAALAPVSYLLMKKRSQLNTLSPF